MFNFSAKQIDFSLGLISNIPSTNCELRQGSFGILKIDFTLHNFIELHRRTMDGWRKEGGQFDEILNPKEPERGSVAGVIAKRSRSYEMKELFHATAKVLDHADNLAESTL